MNNLLLPIAVVLFSMAACKKEPSTPPTPPPYQTKVGKVSCLVNGALWESHVPGINLSASGQYVRGGGLLISMLNSMNEPTTNIGFQISNVFDTGTFFIGSTTPNIGEYNYYLDSSMSKRRFFKTDMMHMGMVKITQLDFDKQEISGTFSVNLYNEETDSVLKISNGVINKCYLIRQ